MKKRLNNILVAVMAAMLSVSCGFAEINYSEESESGVNISMDWSQVEGEHPDTMYVIASRIVNAMTLGYLYPDMTPLHDSTMVADSMIWPTGDYSLLCFNKRDDMTVADMESLRRLCISLPVLTEEDVTAVLDSTVRDFNPDIPYIGDAGEFYADAIVQTIQPAEEATEVVFTPKSLTQELVLTFSLDVAEDVFIKDVHVVLSGLVGTVFPLTGVVNYKDLYKMVLPVHLVEILDGRYTYEARANILGIFPSESETATTGKGVMQLIVSSKSYLGERVFYTGINLYNTINQAAPMIVNEDNLGYSIASDKVDLNVQCVLKISTEAVIDCDENDGVDKWFENEYIDVEM